jgi:two-component system OmpR family response regulator
VIGRRALLVDDNDDHREWLATALRDRSWDIIATRSGKHALDVAPAQRPHVIVCELVLPDVLGLQLARAFRTALDHDVTIIAATRVPGLEAQALAATYDHVLGKPIDLMELFARVIGPSPRAMLGDSRRAALRRT